MQLGNLADQMASSLEAEDNKTTTLVQNQVRLNQERRKKHGKEQKKRKTTG